MFDPVTIFKGISTTTAIVSILNSLIRGTKGIKRGLLIELQSNIHLIMLYTEGGAPIDKVIDKLDVAKCKAALESNFNFSSLRKGRVSKAVAKALPQYRAYVGWTTEQLFSNIYLKVRQLQHIVDIDADNKKFRKSVRLINILKVMLLLLKHIKSGRG